MNEEEWLNATEPFPMLQYLWDQASDRKLKLFALACCRRGWHFLDDEESRKVVELVERHVDNPPQKEEWDTLRAFVKGTTHNMLGKVARTIARGVAMARGIDAAMGVSRDVACACADDAKRKEEMSHHLDLFGDPLPVTTPRWGVDSHRDTNWKSARKTESKAQAALLRDIFGNPFCPQPTIQPAWLAWNNGSILKLAQCIYAEGCVNDLPVLADALEEASCTNPDILNHCRQPGEHIRGCWLLDLILGKK